MNIVELNDMIEKEIGELKKYLSKVNFLDRKPEYKIVKVRGV